MPTIKNLLPRRTERMLIVGTTGCGKTTLASHLLEASNYGCILVIDPKCMYGGPNGQEGYKLVRRPSDLRKCRRGDTRIQFRPDEKHSTVWDYDEVYRWAYRRRDVMVYTDETFAVMHRSYSPDGLRACITQGRELGVGMIFATQRPKGIDLRILTESEVFAMFELRHREDRKRMAEFMGEEVLVPLPRYAFWFWRAGTGGTPVPVKLTLERGKEKARV